MTFSPTDIKALREPRQLQITWSDSRVDQLACVALRGDCRCAQCVDERTGERILDLNSIPPDINVGEMQLVGNYALRIKWTDGHDTGLYTWNRLRELANELRTATPS